MRAVQSGHGAAGRGTATHLGQEDAGRAEERTRVAGRDWPGHEGRIHLWLGANRLQRDRVGHRTPQGADMTDMRGPLVQIQKPKKTVELTIDGSKVMAAPGDTILDAC